MSSDKLVAIVDDEHDILTLFHDGLRGINGITIIHFYRSYIGV